MGLRLRLSILSGPASDEQTRREHVFDENGGTLGRSARADWVLRDPSRLLSGVHCKFVFENDQFHIADLSTNGVFLNGAAQRLGKGSLQLLSDKDHLRLGDFEIEIQIFDDALGTTTSAVSAIIGNPRELSKTSDALARLPKPAPEPASEPEPASVVDEAEPAAAAAADDQARSGLSIILRELGCPPNAVPASQADEVLRDIAGIVRMSLGGLVSLLAARGDVKSEFNLGVTQLRPSQNNPLKYSASGDEALFRLLVERQAGYLSGELAVTEALDELKKHQLGLLAGYKAAMLEVASLFDPQAIDATAQGKAGSWLGPLAGAARWQAFQKLFARLSAEDFEELQRISAESFARAYEDAQEQ